MYTVKQAAQLLELSQHAIRFYTDRDLVPGVKRDRNNVRQFDERAMHFLTGVKYLRECGMSVAAVKEFMDLCLQGEETLQGRYEILKEQTGAARKRLEEAERTAAFMEGKLRHYEEIINGEKPDDMNPDTWEKAPKREGRCRK